MRIDDAFDLADELMGEHLPTDGEERWTFGFDDAVQRFGACHHRKQRITLSRQLTMLNDEATVRNTLLHEIAHALCGRGHGHDEEWRRVFILLGGDGQRCYHEGVITPTKRWTGRCGGCGEFICERHYVDEKAWSRRWHVACGPERGRVVWTDKEAKA